MDRRLSLVVFAWVLLAAVACSSDATQGGAGPTGDALTDGAAGNPRGGDGDGDVQLATDAAASADGWGKGGDTGPGDGVPDDDGATGPGDTAAPGDGMSGGDDAGSGHDTTADGGGGSDDVEGADASDSPSGCALGPVPPEEAAVFTHEGVEFGFDRIELTKTHDGVHSVWLWANNTGDTAATYELRVQYSLLDENKATVDLTGGDGSSLTGLHLNGRSISEHGCLTGCTGGFANAHETGQYFLRAEFFLADVGGSLGTIETPVCLSSKAEGLVIFEKAPSTFELADVLTLDEVEHRFDRIMLTKDQTQVGELVLESTNTADAEKDFKYPVKYELYDSDKRLVDATDGEGALLYVNELKGRNLAAHACLQGCTGGFEYAHDAGTYILKAVFYNETFNQPLGHLALEVELGPLASKTIALADPPEPFDLASTATIDGLSFSFDSIALKSDKASVETVSLAVGPPPGPPVDFKYYVKYEVYDGGHHFLDTTDGSGALAYVNDAVGTTIVKQDCLTTCSNGFQYSLASGTYLLKATVYTELFNVAVGYLAEEIELGPLAPAIQ